MIDKKYLAELRQNTPGLKNSVHLNHSGASLISRKTLEAIQQHLHLESKLGPMEAAARVQEQLDRSRVQVSRLLNARPQEIALMPSGSAAFGAVFSAMPPLRAGDRILVGRQEWGGNLATYERVAKRAGARVEVIPCKSDGSVDAQALVGVIDERVRLISLTWLPANGGLINDAAAIGRVSRAFGVPYLIDAGQALGQIPIDVEALQCDVLKGAGRKHLRAPRGTAVLYVREKFLEKLEPVYVDVLSAPWSESAFQLRRDARRFETSETPVALWLGFANAVDEALDIGVHRIAAHVQDTAALLRSRLEDIRGLRLHDLGEGLRSGLISFTIDGVDALSVKTQLGFSGIQIAVSGVAYTPLDMTKRGLKSVARISVSYLNDEDDFARLYSEMRRLRQPSTSQANYS